MEEIWKPVVWFEWLYEVSNLGNIKSLDRMVKSKLWSKRLVKKRLLKIYTGYLYYNISLARNWLKWTYFIHRIIAQAFIPNPDNKPCINHKNWNKLDNGIENLEWCTYSENELHSRKILGKKNKTWKYAPTSKWVIQKTIDWCFIREFWSIREASRFLKCCPWDICACCKNNRMSVYWYKWEYADM